jgi:predicted membrane channel-forming protein YqfA (hemolysin III family)
MKNQKNEKAKLTANYLNGIAIAVALAGAFTPTLSGIRDNPGPINWTTAGIVAVCMVVSLFFHLMARRTLNALLD